MRSRSAIIILVLLSIIACSHSSDPLNQVSLPIEGGINFTLSERQPQYNSVGIPRIFLSMSTELIYGCCNYTIVYDATIGSEEIGIFLKGIHIPCICATALGPAQSFQTLDIAEGQYTLLFSDGNRTDVYDLVVTKSAIAVQPRETSFTAPAYELSWRPVTNSFAYLCGTTTATSWICDDFLDTLLTNLDLIELTFPDSGEIPFPRSSSGHYYDAPGKYFIYSVEDDFVKAGILLESYAENVISQYGGIGVNLLNWKGENHRSWLF